MSGWTPPSGEELEMEQIRADIALKRAQTQWEPWKAMTAAFGAGAAFATAIAAMLAFVFSHIMR
jgi:hypothetical protein